MKKNQFTENKPEANKLFQKMYKPGFLLILFLLGITRLYAQDVLFTNYMSTPLQTNPALVAFDNNLKISANYRGRVSKFSQSYNTPMFSIVYPLINQDKSRRWGGIGFSLHSDMSGSSNLIKTTGASLAYAYNLQINERQSVSASLGAGYYRREINLSSMTTGSQYNPSLGFDPGLPINETFSNETKGFLDLFTGLIWQILDKYDQAKAFAGFSAYHLNQPDISFNGQSDVLPMRFNFQAGYKVFDNGKISVFPDVCFDYQAEIVRYNVGLSLNVPFNKEDQGYLHDASLCFKPRYVSDNLVSLGIEFRKSDYIISFTYDFCVSNRMVNSNVVDAYEFYISYKKNLFKYKPKKEKIIPDEHYIVGEERVLNNVPEKVVVKEIVTVIDSSKIIEKEWSEKISTPERKITFNYKSDKVEEEAKEMLDEIIAYLEANQDYVLEIEGHTDNIGDKESNQRNSLRRAKAISGYFIKKGILPSRIKVTGRGESKPIATNATEEGRARNRRVEFILYKVVK